MALDNPAPHPASLPEDVLLSQCEVRRLRRSGPGGQRRNKVETAVVLKHQPTGLTAEANERRSQAQNLTQATFRLRVQLAIHCRSPRNAIDETPPAPSRLWLARCRGGRITVAEDHEDFPALLSEALDFLAWSEGDLKTAANQLECTPSQLVKLLKIEPRAFELVNVQRRERGQSGLK